MQKRISSYWFKQLAVVAGALLLSNVIAIACAVAIDTCSDCPEMTSAHCVSMFDMADVVVSEKTPAGEPQTNSSFAIAHTDAYLALNLINIPTKDGFPISATDIPIYPPPINLVNCVFQI